MSTRASLRLRWLLLLAIPLAVYLAFAWTEPTLPDGLAPPEDRYDVRIVRDTWGVPHIFGTTDADVAYGLAFAHAEDDFATIQGALLAARGRLASELGSEMAANDYMVALLRIDEIVAQGYPKLGAEVRAVCEAYADGLNHYAALHPEEAIARLYPVRGDDVVRGFVHKTPLFFGIDKVLTDLFDEERDRDNTAGTEDVKGSNAFAVAPSRTANGETFLVVNSHQPWTGPVAWYEVHLKSDAGWDMVGGVFPGAPVILHGHNRKLGWAHTVNSPDLIDVYRLEIDPDDEDRYLFDGEWKTLEKRTADINVKLWGPIRWTFEREVLHSVHGPVVRRPHGTYALRFASYGEVGQLEQWYRMNKASKWSEWQSAMRQSAIPMFNTIYADAEGNIFFVYNARLPQRSEGWDYTGDSGGELPGDTSDTLWTDTLAFDELPQVLNPESGYVQNANSSPFQTTIGDDNPLEDDYSSTYGIETRMTNRALRAHELFGSDESITFEELVDYKFDTKYSQQSKMARLVRRVLELRPSGDAPLDEALDILAEWDLDTGVDSRPAALAVLAFGRFIESGDNQVEPSDDELLTAIGESADSLRQHFGSVEVPWGDVNRLRHGEVDLPIGGAPDVLRAVYGELEDDGRLKGVAGDSYILVVAWDAEGRVRSHSIHQFGSATRDASSSHFTDQAEIFVEPGLKPVWIDEEEIRRHLEREYSPGEDSPGE